MLAVPGCTPSASHMLSLPSLPQAPSRPGLSFPLSAGETEAQTGELTCTNSRSVKRKSQVSIPDQTDTQGNRSTPLRAPKMLSRGPGRCRAPTECWALPLRHPQPASPRVLVSTWRSPPGSSEATTPRPCSALDCLPALHRPSPRSSEMPPGGDQRAFWGMPGFTISCWV